MMKKRIISLSIILCCLVVHHELMAQIDLTGKVTDAQTGLPIEGATISIEDNPISIFTDRRGIYSIKLKSPNVSLQIRYIGYQTIDLQTKGRNEINISLVPDNSSLDEVVVVGYGTQSKRNVTGSISKVDMSDTQNLPNTSITQSLRGRVAGVQFTDNGRPGQNGTILIRGPRSISASNAPLIVLDGIIFNGTISDINPNDIATMEILKDASAAAIYGSRASNGVILISSKKGTTEKPNIRINTFSGISEMSYKIKLLTPERYIQKTLDARRENNLEANIGNIEDYLAPNEAENYRLGKTIDPWEVGTQSAGMNSLDVSVSGKSDNTNYYLSGSMTRERGIILNDNQNRLTLRTNFDNQISDWLKTGINAIYAKRNFSGITANVNALLQTSPYGSLYREDGTPTEFIVDGENVAGNLIRDAYWKDNLRVRNNLFANFYALLDFPFAKGLTYRINYSPNLRWDQSYDRTNQDPYLTNNMRRANKSNSNYFDWVLENILTYSKKIDIHSFDATLLYSRSHLSSESTGATALQLSTDALGWNNLQLGETQTVTSGGQKVEDVSYMFRVNYRYKDKYLATFTTRKDGSSVFSTNHKYATFPSGSLAWIASEEGFLQDNRTIDLLKLRVSYGAVGNQAISPYQSLSRLGTSQYVYGDGGETALGYYPSNMANSDLKWETTYSANIGLDFEILKGRIRGTLEWYNMATKDLLVTRSLPRMTGFTSVWSNLGQVNNKGIEITLNTLNIQKENFEWSSNFTFSANQNKIIHLYQSDTDGDGVEDDDLGNNWFIGQPITVYYDYVVDGIYQEGEDLPAGYKPGYTKLRDLNDDGVIDADDRTIIGQGNQPKYRWSIGNDFRYKNLTLSVLINAMQGWISNFGLVGRGPADRSLNFIDYGWWTPENKSDSRPSLLHENKYAHNYYFSRDFIRIQDVALTYNVPQALLSKIKISHLSFSVSGKNLYTFTNWIGADPESGATAREDMYPMPRTVVFGINLGF